MSTPSKSKSKQPKTRTIAGQRYRLVNGCVSLVHGVSESTGVCKHCGYHSSMSRAHGYTACLDCATEHEYRKQIRR